MTSSKKIISGAAIGTLLGSLTAMLYPKRREIIENLLERTEDISELAEKAREYGEALFNKGSRISFNRSGYRNNHLGSGLIGFLLGASAAMLASSRKGRALRVQLARAYNHLSGKSEEFVHHFKNNSHHPFTMNRPMNRPINRPTQSQSATKRKKPMSKTTRKAHTEKGAS